MKSIKLGAALAIVLSASALAACHSGPEGKYSLDKSAMKTAMQAEIAKMPKEQQAFAGLATAMIDAMDMSVELQSGGKLEATSTMPSMDKGAPAKTDKKTGSWKKDGEKVILTIDGKDLSCDPDAKSLKCASDKPGEPGLVFVKS